MATGVINRKPNDIVRPTCSKFSCLTTFEIPYRDRMLARYCPEHDQTGYWDTHGQPAPTEDEHASIKDHPLYHNILQQDADVRIVVKGKRYHIAMISPTGKRVKVKMGGGEPKAMWFDETDGLVVV